MIKNLEMALTPCKSYSKMRRDHRHQLLHNFPFYKKKKESKTWLQYECATLNTKRHTNGHKNHQGKPLVAPIKWPPIPSFLSFKKKPTQTFVIVSSLALSILFSFLFFYKKKSTKQVLSFSHQSANLR